MSPPKRVTRARAAAKKANEESTTSNNKPLPKLSTRKRNVLVEGKSAESDMPLPTVDEPLRKSARRVATAAPARHIKITPMTVTTSPQPAPEQNEKPSQILPKSRATRSKKAIADEVDGEEAANVAEPTKSRRKVTGVAPCPDTTKSTASKPRGRPKKAEVIEGEVVVKSEKAPKQTRARAGLGVTSTRALAVAPSKTTVPKKKVTFQDVTECDKENQPVVQLQGTTKGKAAAPTSGIRAKPVRRPAVTSRVNVKRNKTKAIAEARAQRVLTPKKITQVARSTSTADSDEDELNGAKTPLRDFSQSPRRNINIARTGSPVKKLDFGSEMLASSPAKSLPMSTISSPAKRPFPSPFKEALKESPKRGDFALKLFQAGVPTAGDKANSLAPSSNTMLLQSPKRVALETSMFPPSTSRVGKLPFKASLLQSPPKRPISPVKPSSPVKAKTIPSTPTKEVDVDIIAPDVAVLSHFRASQSPERSSREHTVTPEGVAEEAKCAIDFDESIVDIRSPLKLEGKLLNVLDQVQEDAEDTPIESNLNEDCVMAEADLYPDARNKDVMMSEVSLAAQVVEDVEVRTTIPTSIMLQDQSPVGAGSFLFRAARLGDDDESSEDELQSPVKMFQAHTPATVFGTKTSPSIVSRAALEQNPGFTPLAAQLSGWLASSPDKTRVKHQSRGSFSPVAAQHVPGEVVIDRHSPATSRVSTEPKLSMSTRKSIGSRRFVSQRSSLATSMGGTPDKSSYFADEMAVKDLEHVIESMQDDDEEYDMLQRADTMKTADDTLVEDLGPEAIVEEVEVDAPQELDELNKSAKPNMEVVVADKEGEGCRDVSTELEAAALIAESEDRQPAPETSQESTTSSAYGDENIVFTTPIAAMPEQPTGTPPAITPAAVLAPSLSRAPLDNFTTPQRPQQPAPRFANTVVSKVPLRPEGHTPPIKLPKKRSRSLSAGPPSIKKTPILLPSSRIPRSSTVNTFSPSPSTFTAPSSTTTTPGQQSFMIDDFGDSTLDGIQTDEDDENLPPVTPTTAGPTSSLHEPTTTPKRTLKPQLPSAPAAPILQGAVVFVDVHTTEGADASGIFIELLTQMGAKCVRNWSWNPRASIAVGVNIDGAVAAGAKIGITHVVYKDGGKRTLEKVRDSEGVVKCVGVGWVLE